MTWPDGSKRRAARVPVLARCALGAYPGWWRERYGQDQQRFLEELAGDDRPLRRAVMDLAVGAVRARLRPAGMPQTVGAWRDRARASIAWATVPAIVGLLLVSAIEQHSFRSSMWAGPHVPLSTGGRVAADAMMSFQWASIAMLVLLLAGWGLVGSLTDRVPEGGARRRWLLLVTAPLIAAVVEIGVSILRASLMLGPSAAAVHGGQPLAVSVLSIAWDVVAVAGLLSVFCVVLGARSADLRVSDLRGGVRLAQLTAIVMLIAAVASIAWGIGVTHQAPIPRADLIGSGPGIHPWTGIQTSIAAEWSVVSAGLAVVSAVTARAALVARRSYRMAQELLVLGA